MSYQFQMRGTPHVHSLVCIKHDGIGPEAADGTDPYAREALKKLINKTITANLIPRHESDYGDLPDDRDDQLLRRHEEKNYDWLPHAQYFTDANDPRREPFDPTLNYDIGDLELFGDTTVQRKARRLQIANQIHRCCFTCFKYCVGDDNVCRFCFPWLKDKVASSTDVAIVKDIDKKKRVRLRVIPQRNNANINATFKSPLINCAHGGNSDIQFIMNSHGAAEYAAGYASKAEAPDQKKLQAIFIKTITQLQERGPMITDRDRLNTAAKSVIGSTQVGSVQAIYFILNQDFVISSRQVITTNGSHGKQSHEASNHTILNYRAHI